MTDKLREYFIEKGRAKVTNLPQDTFLRKDGMVEVDIDALGERSQIGPPSKATPSPPVEKEGPGVIQQAIDFLTGTGRAVVGGVRDAAQGAIGMGADLGDTMREAGVPLPSYNTERGEFLSAEETLEVRAANRRLGDDAVPTLPDFEEKSTGVEAFGRGVIAFFAPFIAGGGLKGATALLRIVNATRAGAVADLLFDPNDGTMVFMLKEFEKQFGFDIMPDVFDFFDSKTEDDATGTERLKQRFLQAGEGVILGVVIDGIIEGFGVIKRNPELRERALETLKDLLTDESGVVKGDDVLGVGAITEMPNVPRVFDNPDVRGRSEATPLSLSVGQTTQGVAVPISRVEPEAQSPAMVKAIEESDFPTVIRQAATEEQIRLTQKASRGLAKLPVQLEKGDVNVPRVYSESFGSRLDEDGRKFMSWVNNNPKGKFLHKNGKTNASIDFSTTCARRSCSVGGCLYCYVDAPRVINKLGKEAEEAGGSILDTGLGRAQAKTDRLEHNFDPEVFARMPPSVINAFNMDGGLRMYSFGDYRPDVDRENVQATLDAALERGLWIKAITKDKDFVEIFGDHPALRINISIDSVPTSVSNSWSLDEAIAAKLRYPNLRVRSVALNAEEIDAQAAMKMPDGSPLVDVITLYHGASNFTPSGVRTGKLSKLILAKMNDPEFTPPEAKEKILEQFGGEQGLEDYLDTWQNMGPKNKEHIRARETYKGRVCCTNAKCASDPDTKCGFGVGSVAQVKTIGFLLGFGAAAHPGLPEPVSEIEAGNG
mgnify:CR=1 FL=1|tara:strand:+ start:791 stop:3097 length:2307 start_codon:yes stop_codon:yes gene_type:complete